MSSSVIIEKKIGSKINRTPVVSVIIPAYNTADFISETLKSVVNQTYRNYEIIVVNDGSPDTPEFERAIKKYLERIIYIRQENGGTAAARNTGIDNARGELLAFLDGDDIWLADYLKLQIDQLKAKNCDLIYCDAKLFGDFRDNGETHMKKSPSRGRVTSESLINGTCNVITSGTVARRDRIIEAGMFDESLPRIGMEDFDLWFRLARMDVRLDYQTKVLLKYRVRPNSLSGSSVQRAERSTKALDNISRKFELSDTEKTALERRQKELSVRLETEKGKLNIAQGNYAAARGNIAAAIGHHRKFKLLVIMRFLQINPRMVRWLFQKMRRAEFSFIAPLEK